jgi:RHS repeat-associated protein
MATDGAINEDPQLRTFQFDTDGIGDVKNSVNMFRGDVSLPVRLLSLPGRNGLDFDMTAVYSSDVQANVNTWNVEAPTGVLGLGWSLPYEQIVMQSGFQDKNNPNGMGYADAIYLVSGGASNRLIKTGVAADGAWTYEAVGFQFWTISYYPNDERWEIVKENGSRYIYGGGVATSGPGTSAGASICWGVRFGNWIGSSAYTASQQQYARTWNISRLENAWGDAITFLYNNVQQAVGPGGKNYTKACYIQQVTDTYGATIAYNYANKTYQPGTVCEYQDPHKATPNANPDAYQSQYETLYLDHVTVTNAADNLLLTLRFGYTLFNGGATGSAAYPYLWKRQLTSITQENADGDALPNMQFSYTAANAPLPGALQAITYPDGAVAAYNYSRIALAASRDLAIQSPFGTGLAVKPAVFFGPDYTVVLWYNATGGQLQVSIYSWLGTWVNWTPTSYINAKLDITKINVATGTNFVGITYLNTGTQRQDVYLYRRDPTQSGRWLAEPAKNITLNANAPDTQVASGNDFIMLYNPGFVGTHFQGYWWNPRQNQWVAPRLPNLAEAAKPKVALTAGANYYLACSYNNGSAQFQLLYLDATNNWCVNPIGWNSSFTVYSDPNDPTAFPFAFTPSQTYAVATYVTAATASQINYELRLFQWGATFSQPPAPLVQSYSVPVVNGQPQVPIANTAAVLDLMANNAHLFRYVGTGAVSGWINRDMVASLAPNATYNFGYGLDSAVISQKSGSSVTNQLFTFNPNTPSAAGWSSMNLTGQDTHPTLGPNYATLQNDLYYHGVSGQWVRQASVLPNPMNSETLQNAAPLYIAYEGNSGASANTTVALLQNGGVSKIITLYNQRIYVDASARRPGSQLAGASSFVTYPASAGSFDQAATLHLYAVQGNDVQGAVYDTPVTWLQIDAGDTPGAPYLQSYQYDLTNVVVLPGSGLAQYSLVTVTSGSKDTSGRLTNGWTQYYYSNSLSQKAGVFYTAGWIYNYTSLLNGTLLATQTFDSGGNLVGKTVNYWQVTTQNPFANNRLYGGYARNVRSDSWQDGVQTTVQTQYNAQTGLPATVTQTGGGSEPGPPLSKTLTYANQIPAYSAAMNARHALSLVAQTVYKTGDTVTGSTVVTWLNWAPTGSPQGVVTASSVSNQQTWADGTAWKYAPYGNYAWLGTGGSPAFDFTPGASNPNWIETSQVVAVEMPYGTVVENVDSMGIHGSVLTDTQSRYHVAGCTNASITQGELGAYGFETYEETQGWQFNAANLLPQNNLTDAHTGKRCLMLPATGNQQANLSQTFTLKPTGANRRYLFSFWVKTQSGFGTDSGQAGWTITVGGASPIQVPISDTGGGWQAVSQVIDLGETPPASVSVSLAAYNGKQSRYLLLDDLCFTPLISDYSVLVYTTDFDAVTAGMQANGATMRYVYDAFHRRIGVVGPAEAPVTLTAPYYSRQNSAAFTQRDPNSDLLVKVRSGGLYEDFVDGQWQDVWDGNAGSWSVRNGALVHTGAGADTLTLRGSQSYGAFGARFAVQAPGTLANPLGLALGSQIKIQYTPGTGWQLLVGGQAIAAAAGRPVGRDWTLVTTGKTLLFFVDGARTLAYQASQNVGGPLALFTGDAVAYSQILIFEDPITSLNYYDGAGRTTQFQGQDGNDCIVSQNLYDPLGRAAVVTKSVRYLNSPLGYQPGFITAFDWTSAGVMAGDVSAYYSPTGLGDPSNRGFSDDQGYPYSRTLYESSPLARPRVIGRAGAAFAITNPATPPSAGQHTEQLLYSGSAGPTPSGPTQNPSYLQQLQLDADNNASYAVNNIVGKRVSEGTYLDNSGGTPSNPIQSLYEFDAAFNLTTVKPPNATAMAQTANQWQISMQYDFLRRLSQQTTPDTGTTKFIYDPTGQIRFMQDAVGAANGYALYMKYDAIGRQIESGTFPCDWNAQAATLQQMAITQPAQPCAPQFAPVWRTRVLYDGDGSAPGNNLVGRIWQQLTSNHSNNEADVTETFTYDLDGNALTYTLAASDYGPTAQQISYSYDSLGNITAVNVTAGGKTAFQVVYTYNALGQVIGIGSDSATPTSYAAYTYYPNGSVQTETRNGAGSAPVSIPRSYNSPGWPVAIGGGSVPFCETLTYQGDNGQGSYNGNISAAAYSYSGAGAPTPVSYEYQHDALRRLQVATTDADPSSSLQQAEYDGNGNITQFKTGASTAVYSYEANTSRNTGANRLESVQIQPQSGGAEQILYAYDLNGNVVQAAQPNSTLGVTVDPVMQLPAAVAITGATPAQIAFSYNVNKERVLKAQTNGPIKLYVRGTSALPLLELTRSGDNPETAVFYVYGPTGLIALIDQGQCYFVVQDHLLSNRAVFRDAGNGAIEVVAGYDYSPYGTLVRSYGPNPGILAYLYTGQEFDAEIGLYNYRARFYDSRIGRFYTPDPTSQFASPYLYVGDSPILKIDPSGTISIWAQIGLGILGLVALIGGIALTAVSGGAAAPILAYFGVQAGTMAASIASGAITAGVLAVGGALSGAGASALMYDVTHSGSNFNWSDFGLQIGIGAGIGAATAVISAGVAVASKAAYGAAASLFATQAAEVEIEMVPLGVSAARSSAPVLGSSVGEGASVMGGIASGIESGVVDATATTTRQAVVNVLRTLNPLTLTAEEGSKIFGSAVGSSVGSGATKMIDNSLDHRDIFDGVGMAMLFGFGKGVVTGGLGAAYGRLNEAYKLTDKILAAATHPITLAVGFHAAVIYGVMAIPTFANPERQQ